MISKKQLMALFACSLVGWTVLQATLNLLPIYTVHLGATQALAGNFLALVFAALTAGALVAGWLSARFQRRKAMLIVCGLANLPLTWLMGRVTALWQFAILTALVYFLISIGFTTISILAGISAGELERGKVFGLLAINSSLGAMLGGSASGPIVDHWGYPALFLLSALCWLLQPLIAQLLEDRRAVPAQANQEMGRPVKGGSAKAFPLFLLATLIAFGASFLAVLGRPLRMDALHFDTAAISAVYALGGAVSLPLPFLFGWLSDRLNRYSLVIVCFLSNAVGLLILAGARSFWEFGLASILLSGVGISMGVGPALVTDLVAPDHLSMALSWYSFAPSMGGILGFALSGYAFQGFGMPATFWGGALFSLLPIALVFWVRHSRTAAHAVESSSNREPAPRAGQPDGPVIGK